MHLSVEYDDEGWFAEVWVGNSALVRSREVELVWGVMIVLSSIENLEIGLCACYLCRVVFALQYFEGLRVCSLICMFAIGRWCLCRENVSYRTGNRCREVGVGLVFSFEITGVFHSAILVGESVHEYLVVGHGDFVGEIARNGIV